MKYLPLSALALTLAACSPSSNNSASSGTVVSPAGLAMATPTPTPTPSTSPPATTTPTLTLAGLGALTIGGPVPARSSWSALGGQASDACTTLTSPDFPGAYAIVEGGKVRRVSVGPRSDVRLIEGIGIGTSEQQVTAAFPGFRATPHKYVEAPGKYLTAPNAESGDVALRFEIGADRTVTAMHVGTMPALEYVEGCA